MTEEYISKIKAQIALDNFWYYLWNRPDFAEVLLNTKPRWWGRLRRRQMSPTSP